jgi:hypothetical protein
VAAVSRLFAVAISCCIATVTIADDQQATSDYLIHCQGCHLPQAFGVPGHVPRMNNFLGYYLHSEAGRRFVVQVPGAATANLTDARLANLMNWLLLTYSEAQLPDNFKPYSVEEISRLRPNLEPDPMVTRVEILQSIAVDLPALASEMGSNSDY